MAHMIDWHFLKEVWLFVSAAIDILLICMDFIAVDRLFLQNLIMMQYTYPTAREGTQISVLTVLGGN